MFIKYAGGLCVVRKNDRTEKHIRIRVGRRGRLEYRRAYITTGGTTPSLYALPYKIYQEVYLLPKYNY